MHVHGIDQRNKANIGYIGETHVIAKLARDFGIACVKVPQQFFPYDLITSNHKRLEVKTSRIVMSTKRTTNRTYKTPTWQFTRSKQQLRNGVSDFVICIGIDNNEPPGLNCFIIPSHARELLGPRTGKLSEVISITVKPKTKSTKWKEWQKYRDKWELIAT